MTKARDLANIISGGFTADDIPNIDASKITTGSIADARIPASAVSQHATSFDDNKIVNDISTLAIRQASNENKGAYNTNSMFVDVFQDSSGIASHTTSARNSSEYVSTSTTGTGQFTSDSNTLILLHMDGSDNGTTFNSTSNIEYRNWEGTNLNQVAVISSHVLISNSEVNSNGKIFFEITLYGMVDNTIYTTLYSKGVSQKDSFTVSPMTSAGYRTTLTSDNAIRLSFETPTTDATISYKVYGIK